MRQLIDLRKSTPALVSFALMLTLLSFAKIHYRVGTTLIGYEIGRLKMKEGELLERKSLLRMQLSQLTSRRHLELISQTDDFSKDSGTLASK